LHFMCETETRTGTILIKFLESELRWFLDKSKELPNTGN
jgi:hypothetical protein